MLALEQTALALRNAPAAPSRVAQQLCLSDIYTQQWGVCYQLAVRGKSSTEAQPEAMAGGGQPPSPGVGHCPSSCGEPAGALTKGPTHPERGHSSTSSKQAAWMQPHGLGGCRLFPGLFLDLFHLLTDTSHTVQNEI